MSRRIPEMSTPVTRIGLSGQQGTSEPSPALRRHDERRYSFVDATSFAVMRRLRIREALAFDGDFSAAGFTEVRP